LARNAASSARKTAGSRRRSGRWTAAAAFARTRGIVVTRSGPRTRPHGQGVEGGRCSPWCNVADIPEPAPHQRQGRNCAPPACAALACVGSSCEAANRAYILALSRTLSRGLSSSAVTGGGHHNHGRHRRGALAQGGASCLPQLCATVPRGRAPRMLACPFTAPPPRGGKP
jgi:hypothetical protein